jgi:magnesium transporter
MKKMKLMSKMIRRISKKVAQPPGTLIHLGERKSDSVVLNLIRYNKDFFEEKRIENPGECLLEKDFKGVCWIDISGIHDIPTIESIGRVFNIHPLVQEDILNTFHRPKFEESEEYLFLVLKMLMYDTEAKDVMSEQVSFVLGPDFLITFQEQEGDVFNPVRERLRKALGRIRKMRADFLLYTLMDAVVDNYFLVMEAMGEDLEILEAQLLENPTPKIRETIHKLKRELIFLRRAVWPLRELINGMQKSESRLIKNPTKIYLRDVYDHTIHVIETVETYRDMISGLQDLYLSSVSNKMNEVMKVLTIIATIFIPVTFIAGIYGMNFEFMPELKWRYGYFFVWGVMVVISLGMVLYFKRKKWL